MSRIVAIIWIAFFAISVCAERVQAATYYLSPSGSDSANGSSSAPWRTIGHADDAANSGDTVILKNGVYAGNDQAYQVLDKTGITWKAENQHQAVIDGGFAPSLLNGSWDNIVSVFDNTCGASGRPIYPNLFEIRNNQIVIDGIFLKNSCGRGIYVADDVSGAVVKNSKIDWTMIAGFYADGETTNMQFLNNELTRISFNDEYAQKVRGYCQPANTPPDEQVFDYCVNISIHMSGENMVVRDNIIAFGRGEIAMTGARNLYFEKNIIVANKNNFYGGWIDGAKVNNNIFWSPDDNEHPGTHWEKSNHNPNDWHMSSRNENDERWQNYSSGMKNIAYYNNLFINNSLQFNGYHEKPKNNLFSTDTTNIYFGHNTVVTGPHTDNLFKLSFQQIIPEPNETVTGDAQITAIIESNIFDVSKNPTVPFAISLSSNDSVYFRNNIMPASAPSAMKSSGDKYTTDPGLTNSIVNLNFPIPEIGAASVDMTGLRNAVNLNNYRLKNTSPAINAGSIAGAVGGIDIPQPAREKDMTQTNRSGTPDIGALEYTETNNPTPTTNSTMPGDYTNDSRVNIHDQQMIKNNFGTPYTIFDYNAVVTHYTSL